MAISQNSLSPLQITLLGVLEGLPQTEPTPFLNMFANAPVVSSATDILEFDYRVNKNKTAELLKKGSRGKEVQMANDWLRVRIQPGEQIAKDIITADELKRMMAGETEVFRIGGQQIKTSQQLAQMKMQSIKDSIVKRQNIMCAQLINDGNVYFSDGVNSLDYDIPVEKTVNYDANTVILSEIRKMLSDYRKITGLMPDKILIGASIVDKMLGDVKVQDTMYKMGYTNVAQGLEATEKALIIGTLLGQTLEQMDFSFDDKGVEIIADNKIKMLSTSQFRRGYTALNAINPATNLPDLFLGEYWTGIESVDSIGAKATLFGKSGFFPIVIDPKSIQTWNVVIE